MRLYSAVVTILSIFLLSGCTVAKDTSAKPQIQLFKFNPKYVEEPENLWEILEKESDFKSVTSARDLPPSVVSLCADPDARIADPGKKWEVGDVITDPNLPMARLIWAVTNGEYFVVHHEHGGIGYNCRVSIIRLRKGEQKPKLVWNYIFYDKSKSYSAFLGTLQPAKD